MQHVRLIIWDMDGVKYTISEEFQNRYMEAVGKAASQLVPNLSFEDAHELAKRSKRETGRSMKLFTELYQLDTLHLGTEAEKYIELTFLEPSPSFIKKLEAADVDHMILTDANPVWADRILTQMQLSEFYSKRHRVTRAEYEGVWKRDSRLPFELALKRSGYAAENCLMIEDTPENLVYPKEMGMITVLVDPHGKAEPQTHIDHIFSSAEAFLDHFNNRRKT